MSWEPTKVHKCEPEWVGNRLTVKFVLDCRDALRREVESLEEKLGSALDTLGKFMDSARAQRGPIDGPPAENCFALCKIRGQRHLRELTRKGKLLYVKLDNGDLHSEYNTESCTHHWQPQLDPPEVARRLRAVAAERKEVKQ